VEASVNSVQMGYDDAGRHYQDIGSLKEAEKSFIKEREFCQTPSHVAIMTFRLISLFIERKSWMTVESNALKLRDMIQSNQDAQGQRGIIPAIAGLAQLSMGEYQRAATTFLDTDISFLQAKPGNEIAEDPAGLRGAISPNDVATYGAICALASMNRTDLQKRVLENTTFRQFLELEPHLRRAISFFIGGKFSQCLTILQSYRADYLLDMNIYPHFSALFDRIRNKAIIQYFIPFSRVTFKALSEAFNTDEAIIQNTLVELIKSGQLAGRLDLEKGLLIANTADRRSQVHQEALESARNFERTMHQRILRIEAIASGLEVRATKQKTTADGASGDILMGADGNRGGRAVRQR
jgi:COP9 signalosome complex subunit 1